MNGMYIYICNVYTYNIYTQYTNMINDEDRQLTISMQINTSTQGTYVSFVSGEALTTG